MRRGIARLGSWRSPFVVSVDMTMLTTSESLANWLLTLAYFHIKCLPRTGFVLASTPFWHKKCDVSHPSSGWYASIVEIVGCWTVWSWLTRQFFRVSCQNTRSANFRLTAKVWRWDAFSAALQRAYYGVIPCCRSIALQQSVGKILGFRILRTAPMYLVKMDPIGFKGSKSIDWKVPSVSILKDVRLENFTCWDTGGPYCNQPTAQPLCFVTNRTQTFSFIMAFSYRPSRSQGIPMSVSRGGSPLFDIANVC